MAKPWLLWLLVLGAEGATHALHLTADGEVWDFPFESSKRLVRHEKHPGHPAYVQQEQNPSGTAKILSNNTARMDDFLRTLREDAAEAHLGVALGITGPLLCVMALFYMVSQKINQDLTTCTWQLLSGNIALFVTVLTFMALKKCCKLIAGSQAGQMALVGEILAFVMFIVLLIGVPLLRSKLEGSAGSATRWLPALRTTGAYLIGFAGADCSANFLRREPFNSGPLWYSLGMLLVFCILAVLLALAWRVSRYGRPSDAAYEPEREAEQIDAAGFQIGFLMSMWIRFLITGFLPGSKKQAHALGGTDLVYLGSALLVSLVVFALMMWKVRPLADSTERKPLYRRIFRILTESSAMTMGWLLMYWVQWAFWYFHQSPDGSHRFGRNAALMSQAIGSTVFVYAGVIGLVFLAKRMGKKVSDFTELSNAFVLQTGFCWEMAIYVGLVDSFTAKMPDPTGRRIAAIVWICFLLVMIIPAWFWYILPKAQTAVPGDGKTESGDAKPQGVDAKAESGDVKAETGDAKADSGDAKAESGEAKAESSDAKTGDAKAEGGSTAKEEVAATSPPEAAPAEETPAPAEQPKEEEAA